MGITGKVRNMEKGPERTLLEVCVSAAGGDLRAIPKGMRVCEFIMEWTLATKALGHDPSVSEFGRWWKHSERQQNTVWRRLREFRQLFPDETTPERFAALIIEHSEARNLSPLSRFAV